MKKTHDPRLVFLDLETTGLSVENDVILEIGIMVATPEFGVQGEPWSRTINAPDAPLRITSGYVREMHTKSGLLAELVKGEPLVVAEAAALAYLHGMGFKPGTATLAGYSPHFDRGFLYRHMPALHSFFDYRMVDVSTIRGMARRLVDADIDKKMHSIFGETKHRAIADCAAALSELEFYSRFLFDLDGLRKAMQEF